MESVELQFSRETTISWLESNQDNGFFEGQMEEYMEFEELENDDLEWYFYEWVLPDYVSQFECH